MNRFHKLIIQTWIDRWPQSTPPFSIVLGVTLLMANLIMVYSFIINNIITIICFINVIFIDPEQDNLLVVKEEFEANKHTLWSSKGMLRVIRGMFLSSFLFHHSSLTLFFLTRQTNWEDKNQEREEREERKEREGKARECRGGSAGD